MTREEYYLAYREQRVKRRKHFPASSSSMVAALKELYTFALYGKDEVKYELILRYEEKISSRLRADKEALRKLGKEQGKAFIKDLVFRKNPLLDLIKADSGFHGKFLPIPWK